MFESVSPSVVFITTVQHVRDFFNRNVMRLPQGTGSGFIWDEQGRVITNFHVIRGAQQALVTLGDQRTFQARPVGASPEHDIAVLAIGNPFGLDHTLTTGIVSALNRTVENEAGGVIDNVIQTDAAINPGNSGGPLIDIVPRLIGYGRYGRVTLGDVIEAVDGRPVEDLATLVNVLDAREFGDRITLRIRRGEQRLDLAVTLGSATR